jgi:RNA polymerase sigma-70 factor (ECF subfamily)
MQQGDKSTADIVRELQSHRDQEANFRILVDRYYDQVKRFLRRKGLSTEDAEELTQDAFISVYKSLGALNEPSQFQAWLFRIALNAFRNHLERGQAKKREGIHVELADGAPEDTWVQGRKAVVLASDDDPARNLIESERKAAAYAAIEALPDQMRRCLQLRLAEELSNQEIALVMGISINTVKAHLQQARKVLAEKLHARLGEL